MDELKKELKDSITGKVMLRKNRNYKGLEKMNIDTYDVYFDTPTTKNKELIKKLIEDKGYKASGFRIIGGSYGYVITFNTKKD